MSINILSPMMDKRKVKPTSFDMGPVILQRSIVEQVHEHTKSLSKYMNIQKLGLRANKLKHLHLSIYRVGLLFFIGFLIQTVKMLASTRGSV
jgi:hypothetical protein